MAPSTRAPRRRPDLKSGRALLLAATTYGTLPAPVAIAGVVLTKASPGIGWALMGLSAWLVAGGSGQWPPLKPLLRIGAAADRTHDLERAAREYFDEHGHWPNDRPDGEWP